MLGRGGFEGSGAERGGRMMLCCALEGGEGIFFELLCGIGVSGRWGIRVAV